MVLIGAFLLCFEVQEASAFYNSQTGRWLSRDPLGEQETISVLYVVNGNDLVNNIDADGRITVTEGPRHLTDKTCGGYDVQFTFTLDHPTIPPHFRPPYGFLVQEVSLMIVIFKCDGFPKRIEFQHWYEMAPWNGNNRFEDTSSFPKSPSSYGYVVAAGTIKYFSKLTTGDLTKNPNWHQTTGRGPNVESTPPWWNFPSANGESTGYRVSGSSWNCCCCRNSSTPFANP